MRGAAGCASQDVCEVGKGKAGGFGSVVSGLPQGRTQADEAKEMGNIVTSNAEIAILITAICSGAAALFGAWWAGRKVKAEIGIMHATQRKADSDADRTVVAAANDVVETLRHEIDLLRQRIESLEAQVREERGRYDEIAIKYQQALSKIVELEAENLRLRRQSASLSVELAKLEQRTAQLEKPATQGDD
jgi:chromosome segregation ATPase